MAPLAIDSFRQTRRESSTAIPEVGARFDLRITVVAKKAAISRLTAEAKMIGPVVRGAHVPIAAFFGVPRQRKLDQRSGRRAMQIAAGVVSRSEYVVDLAIQNVLDGAIGSGLMPAQIVLAIFLRWGEILPGGAVMECLAIELRKRCAGRHAAKGPPHAGSGVILGNLAMTTRAQGRVYIPGVDRRLRLDLAPAENGGDTQQNDRYRWFSSPDRGHRQFMLSQQDQAPFMRWFTRDRNSSRVVSLRSRKAPEHGAGDGAGVLFFHAAHHHAEVARFADHADAQRIDHVLDASAQSPASAAPESAGGAQTCPRCAESCSGRSPCPWADKPRAPCRKTAAGDARTG